MKRALLAICCALALAVAPAAHADDDDVAYLQAVQSVKVPAASPAAASAYGRALCGRLPAVGFDPLVGIVHADNAPAGVTMHQAALIIGAAISNYCLEETALLPKTLNY